MGSRLAQTTETAQKEQEGCGFNAHFCGVLGYRKGPFYINTGFKPL